MTMKAASETKSGARRWVVRRAAEGAAPALARALGLSTVVAGVLAARGFSAEEPARALLRPSLEQLHDPHLMLGMREAAERVLRAVDAGERILIYGDYDVDGTTGTVVLRRALEVLGAQTGYHVPHRFTEGYGIRRDVLERAQAEGYTLVISVDCGIRAHEPLEWARTNGLDVIVTDHHLPDEGEGAPPALAVLNPNQRGCAYPDKTLAGVGVAFKLAHALLREDAGFHAYQMLEAGVRQFREWGNCDQGRHILIAAVRYLAAHFPTQRALLQTADIASRLTRGGELHREVQAVG